MTLRSQLNLRVLHQLSKRKFGTLPKIRDITSEQFQAFRTTESDPRKHMRDHLNRLYTVPSEIQDRIFRGGAIPNNIKSQIKTFGECAFLVRQPAIEVISYLTHADYTRPINKYVLYGNYGTGKTVSLLHILHYAFMQKAILVHIPWVNMWIQYPKESATSLKNPSLIDLPVDAGIWLGHFKAQNEPLLTEFDLRTTREYVWNQRETTHSGAPLIELIKHGINRIRFACGVVDALLYELRVASTAGKCKTFVIMDGYNAFLTDRSQAINDDKVKVPGTKISLTRAFMDMVKADWCNGAVILTLDLRVEPVNRASYLPRYLLRKEGFEHLDPFIPVHIENYSKCEFETIIDYYKNRKWIRNITPQGQQELYMLSNANPGKLMEACNSL